MTPLDREEIKGYLGENETQINESISDAKNEILAKIDESAESSGSGAAPSGVQEFTTSGTFTVPEGVHKIWVTACGGQGGSGTLYIDASSTYGGDGGDGGSCIIREPFSVAPGEEISITIGNGGAAGAYSSGSHNVGGVGGTTVVGSLVTLPGGGSAEVLVGSGKGGSGGATDYDGAVDGADGVRGKGGIGGAHSQNDGGGGGGSYGNGGNGGKYRSSTEATVPGYGGGGAGGYFYSKSKNSDSTAGGNGICIIEW